MPALLRDRLFVVWILLVAVTLLSAAIGGAIGRAWVTSPVAITSAVLAIAFVKARIVMFTYMDVRGAPFALRALCTGWIVVVLAVLLAIYGGVLS